MGSEMCIRDSDEAVDFVDELLKYLGWFINMSAKTFRVDAHHMRGIACPVFPVFSSLLTLKL